MADEPQISEAEWQVMDVIWRKAPITALEVVESLAETGWRPTTIKTLLHRLVRKQFLAFDAIGNKYRYTPCVEREACLRKASHSFVARFFGGDALPMVLHLVQSG